MYRRHTGQLSMLDDPEFFGSLPLDPNNRWIKLSKQIPWQEFDLKYRENFKSKKGQPACDSRMALGRIQRMHNAPGISSVYRKAYGHYPQRVLADTIFRTRENLRYCKEQGIHMNGSKLGKPHQDIAERYRQKKLEWLESGERGEIERQCAGNTIIFNDER